VDDRDAIGVILGEGGGELLLGADVGTLGAMTASRPDGSVALHRNC
jgi:hypothetical protein